MTNFFQGRRLALSVLLVLILLAGGAVALAMSQNKVTALSPGVACGKGEVRVNLDMPSDPSQVKILVLNSTATRGLGSQVSGDFQSRKFKVVKVSNTKPAVGGVAEIRYGPDEAGVAWYLNAFFFNEAKLVLVKARTNGVVDVVLGNKFRKLASETEKNQAVAAAGRPQLPKGGCQAD